MVEDTKDEIEIEANIKGNKIEIKRRRNQRPSC